MVTPSTFTPIQNLVLNGQFVNVIGVVVDFLPPTPTAGKDWQCTFNLADERSTNEGQRVKLFSQREKMPPIRGTGDVVILRQIQLKNYRGANFLLFNWKTTWTVFHLDRIPKERPNGGEVNIPYMATPNAQNPAKDDMLCAIDLANMRSRGGWTSKVSEAGALEAPEPTPIMPFREKFSLIADVGANKYFDLIGQVVKMFPTGDRLDLYITDYTENCLLYDYNAENQEGQDAGRDGDEYAYIPSVKRKAWKGPSGKYTLTVTLFWPHVSFAQTNVRESDYVLLRNVHIKLGKNGTCRLEGALHTDQKFPERVDIEKVSAENEDRVKDLLRRKKNYLKEHPTGLSGADSTAGTKRSREEPVSTKNTSKSKRKTVQKKRRKAEHRGEVPSEAPTDEPQPNAQSETGSWASKHASLEANKNIACMHPDRPTRTVADINNIEKSHVYISPDGLQVPVPFVNQLFRTKVRVVDFQPADLADFAVRTSEFDHISDVEEDETSSPHSSSRSSSPASSGGDGDGDEPTNPRKRWTWFFTLIVQDAHDTGPKDHRDRMAIHLVDEDAEFLLGMDAVNLRKERNESVLHELREKLFLFWGDLEERKTGAVAARTALADRDNVPERTPAQDKAQSHRERVELRNAATPPFVCCVKEYGVEKSKGVWKRRFRMFGTSIQ